MSPSPTDGATTRSDDAWPALGRRVLVPVANPASARPLLRLAARIAAGDGGEVELLTTVPVDADADHQSHAWAGLAAAEDAARRIGVRARGRVVVAPDPAQGVLHEIETLAPSMVLMGWRGRSSTSNVFGRLLDTVVGRSSAPLAVVRLGTVPDQRILLPISADHLLPAGRRGLSLAAALATRLRHEAREPLTLLRTGPTDQPLPPELDALGDRVHHDPRRIDRAVESLARPDDLVIAPVAPTVSGLRAATTHLAWAAPDATLLAAIDVGPQRQSGLDRAVADVAGPAVPVRAGAAHTRAIPVQVTARFGDEVTNPTAQLAQALSLVGDADHLMAWWESGDPRPQVTATVTVWAPNRSAAVGSVMRALRDADELRGTELYYEVDRGERTTDPALVRLPEVRSGDPR